MTDYPIRLKYIDAVQAYEELYKTQKRAYLKKYGELWEVGILPERESYKPKQRYNYDNSGPQLITDSLGEGVQGIFSHADGKHYDSKSAYYAALKREGKHVIEPGEMGKPRETQGDFNVRKELGEAIRQHLN